jgi:hypothetical protein
MREPGFALAQCEIAAAEPFLGGIAEERSLDPSRVLSR